MAPRRARSTQGARTCRRPRRLRRRRAQAQRPWHASWNQRFALSDSSNGSPDELFNNAVDMAGKPDHVPVRVCRTLLSGKIGKAYTLVWCPGERRRQRHQPRSSLTRGDRTSAVGHARCFGRLDRMSAIPSTASERATRQRVEKCQKATLNFGCHNEIAKSDRGTRFRR